MINLFEHTFYFADFFKILYSFYKDFKKLSACERVNTKIWICFSFSGGRGIVRIPS